MKETLARSLYYLTMACVVVTTIALIPTALLVFLGALFGVADGAGAPNASPLLSFLFIFPAFGYILWTYSAPLLELFIVFVLNFLATYFLYQSKRYWSSSIVALALFLVAVPFVRAEMYVFTRGISSPVLFGTGVDASSYKKLINDTNSIGLYSIDTDRVYCGGIMLQGGDVLQGADPTTFMLLPNQNQYAKDARHVWFSCNEIVGADAPSFAVMPQNKNVSTAWSTLYATDTQAVYFQGSVIPDADPESYTLLSDVYEKDKNHVWSGSNIISGADPASFRVLIYNSTCEAYPRCPPTAKDRHNVYLYDKVVGQSN